MRFSNEKADRDVPADQRIVTLSTCICQVLSVTFRGVKVLGQSMSDEESSSRKALKLVDIGLSPAEAAKVCGISRQAVIPEILHRFHQRDQALRFVVLLAGGKIAEYGMGIS